MGSEAQIPFIDFSGMDEQEGESWKVLCSKVREALESHGCFILLYDKFSKQLREDMIMAMKTLFDLPEETKNKYVNPRPYCSYVGKNPIVPLHESFGIDIEPGVDAAQAFTNLMWPEENQSFCGTLKSICSEMLELNHTILKMIFESFGIGNLYSSYVQDNTSVFRLMKYGVPPSINESAMGLIPHTDKNSLTVLCQNEVQGLEVLNKRGDWVPLMVPNNALVVIVGDALKAWSNARLTAPRHRVVMSGNKERYSFGLFSLPKEEAAIEVPTELVDNDHPLLYRPFKFSDYFSYFVNNVTDDALEIYATLHY